MGYRDVLDFRGSAGTQFLRDQHVTTVDFCEAYLSNSIPVEKYLEHVNYCITVHFPIEDNILFRDLRPLLRKYLEFEEPLLVIAGEHRSIEKQYRAILSPAVTESDEELELTPEEVSGLSEKMARVLLQHIFREETGVFEIADRLITGSDSDRLSHELMKMAGELEVAAGHP